MANWQALNNTCLQKFVPRLERDMPDQAAADARHAKREGTHPELRKAGEKVSQRERQAGIFAASHLKALYEAADKRPDKRYSVWSSAKPIIGTCASLASNGRGERHKCDRQSDPVSVTLIGSRGGTPRFQPSHA